MDSMSLVIDHSVCLLELSKDNIYSISRRSFNSWLHISSARRCRTTTLIICIIKFYAPCGSKSVSLMKYLLLQSSMAKLKRQCCNDLTYICIET
ncbi:hypothetical protein BDV34DRAFT_205351 [Aspergillus parasiticus]|uniref:Uncharacterized protein n=1 Tax=Aspergillus parasiticus TaxID=5067 RepID=A0A5N6D7E1_ASPPA|nr:hypothetical protein BDV34DRAFT_205351 [Aspergillus parasiticus]